MTASHWHKLYTADINASAAGLFGLVADLPNYGRWLPGSTAYGSTTDVEPYPVRLGSRYHDGKPGQPGKEWWGEVTGFQPPGSLDFHHTITVRPLRATVDTHIHYSFEPAGAGTRVTRWLVLTIDMPVILRPLRRLIIGGFDTENLRTMGALAGYAEAHTDELTDD
jgi:Polyketide cyclase / dehydrase and lipid transport